MAEEKVTVTIDVPDIVVEITCGAIICGETRVDIEKKDNQWVLSHTRGYIQNSTHRRWDDAQRNARMYAVQTERERLITVAAKAAL